ncbi:hypothetical protein GCM10027256_00850 [Novispirillum itersonii subsp. nipponicum]
MVLPWGGQGTGRRTGHRLMRIGWRGCPGQDEAMEKGGALRLRLFCARFSLHPVFDRWPVSRPAAYAAFLPKLGLPVVGAMKECGGILIKPSHLFGPAGDMKICVKGILVTRKMHGL